MSERIFPAMNEACFPSTHAHHPCKHKTGALCRSAPCRAWTPLSRVATCWWVIWHAHASSGQARFDKCELSSMCLRAISDQACACVQWVRSDTCRVGQSRLYTHRIWPYVWWFPCQTYRIYYIHLIYLVMTNPRHAPVCCEWSGMCLCVQSDLTCAYAAAGRFV